MLGRFPDEIFRLSATRASLNNLVCVSARFSGVASVCDGDHFEQKPQVICLLVVELSVHFLLIDKRSSIPADASSETKVQELDKEEHSVMRVCSTTHPIASISHSIYVTDRLSIIRDFLKRASIKVQFTWTEDKNWGFVEQS